jgi:DNA-binding response OmpR family regulator
MLTFSRRPDATGKHFRGKSGNVKWKEKMMSKSILVVTEEPITRYLLRLVLERDGYGVFEADYGMDALNHVREFHPDILILDATRRNKDGFVVCCPNDEERPAALMPAMMLNGKTQFDVLKEVLSASITNFLPQPVLGQDLIKSVRVAVRGSAFAAFPELQPA